MTSASNDELLVTTQNRIVALTFNRPQALNALSFDMIKSMRGLFTDWANDPNIVAVISQGSGEKAYCAGGDVRGLYHSATGAGARVHEDFFRAEYTLNYQLHRFFKATGKPYIAMMDGIVMGGGMGVGQPATIRIVGDRTKMAMPETKIGLFPDVGGTYFLSRSPGALGLYIGLTSNIIGGSDAIAASLADLYMTREAQTAFIAALNTMQWSSSPLADISRLAKSLSSTPPLSALHAQQDCIERHFANKADVSAIITSLRAESDPTQTEWTNKIANDILLRSPTLLEVVKRQIETGVTLNLAECFRRELNMVHTCFAQGDVVEGIRALAIDKDNQPKWQPPSLQEVTSASVDAFFAPHWQNDAHPLRDLEQQFG